VLESSQSSTCAINKKLPGIYFPPMNSNEFSLYQYYNLTLKLWWLVIIATILGGMLGFTFYYLHAPLYEATATYFVTLDLTHFPIQGTDGDLIQYNEDMAVNTTEGALLSTPVLRALITQLKSSGISLTFQEIMKNYTIERKHDVWELRYRSPVPSVAQTIVNTWAQIGYQEMLAWQASGQAPEYVNFQPPSQALLPTMPVLYGRNNLIIAGALIGFIIGIVISSRASRIKSRTSLNLG
jgi:capsular polysaccharide biosynthesis protein